MKQTRSTYLLRLFLPMFFLWNVQIGYSQLDTTYCLCPDTVALNCDSPLLPTVSIGSDSSGICLNAIVIPDTSNITGYLWWIDNDNTMPVSNMPTYCPPASGHYTVGVTIDGCSVTSAPYPFKDCELQAHVNQLAPTVCENAPTTLTAVGLMGCPPYTYQWSYNNQTTQSITPIASHTATHSVTVTDFFGCTATAQAVVCVNYAGFSATPTNQVIVKPKPGVDLSFLEECLNGTVINTCTCDSIYLIRLHDIDTSNPCFLLDIEERKKGASMSVEEESFNVNYLFEYCENESSSCKNEPNDAMPLTSPVVVGLIDTGVDGNTSINQWQTDAPECQGGSIGFDFTDGGNPWIDDRGHGTHLAHIIQSSDEDVHSVFSARIISEENRDSSSLFGLICSMNAFNAHNDLALDEEKVKVVNLSVGMYGLKPTLLEEAIDSAKSRDIIVVCSAGNGYGSLDSTKLIMCPDTICEKKLDSIALAGIDMIIDSIDTCTEDTIRFIIVNGDSIPFFNITDTVGANMDTLEFEAKIFKDTIITLELDHYPSEFPDSNIISVTAWNYLDDERPEWGNTSPVHVDLAAPGVGIQAYVSSDSKESKDGTSQATAFVTREIARLWAENPGADYWEIIGLLQGQVMEESELDTLTAWGGRLSGDVVMPCEEVLVPTVSEWGLIILALILLNLGVLYIRQTQLISVE